MPYTISDQAMSDAITQAGYVSAALANVENLHPSLPLTALHRQLNALALLAANAIIDTGTSSPVASDTFGGNGSISGTTPQSGGTDKA